jgi:hypothetical protein
MRLKLALAVALASWALPAIDSGASASGRRGGSFSSPRAPGSSAPARAPRFPGPACGASSAATLAGVDGRAAERIYKDEIAGIGPERDKQQVESYAPLLSALAEGNRTATQSAVTALVYSHTHIVRLRVIRNGAVVSDVGGPYIIAPVAGTLRYRGQVVGTYLLSVQDDLGYVGLEKRFIGLPLAMFARQRRVPIKGTLRIAPGTLPDRGQVTFHQRSYEVYSFTATAFPSGPLRISILRPSPQGSRASCLTLRMGEIGRIAHRIWNRFVLDATPIAAFATFAGRHTGALVYVKSGTQQLSGSTPSGPPHLPASGVLHYHGRRYAVTSFESSRPVHLRVFSLLAF